MYSHHNIVDLRGNVNTRLSKLHSNKDWNAAIFAKAGLDRIGLLSQLRGNYGFEYSDLDSFVPAPAQGAMMITAMGDNTAVLEAVSKLNDAQTQLCVDIERRFLRELEGGCTAPIGAIAQVIDNQINFKGCLLSIDGKERIDVQDQITLDKVNNDCGLAFAKAQSEKVFANGGKAMMQSIKTALNS
ncbi:porphobilinogen deaminase [Nonlabens ulvanivorans]|nr:porphobilinogen deaminase [Nonlabens ulvanivorans]